MAQSAALPGFVTVMDIAELVVPIACAGKLIEAGESVASGTAARTTLRMRELPASAIIRIPRGIQRNSRGHV